MASERTYMVEFRARLDDAARGALEAAGVAVAGGVGSQAIPLGSTLPDADHYYATLDAGSREEAAARVGDVLREAGVPFQALGVEEA